MSETLAKGKTLFIGAHCDDIEIGCGGTAAKLAKAGNPVAFAIATPENPATTGEASAELRCQNETRRAEATQAAAVLGLSEGRRTLFFGSLPDAELDQHYKELREWLRSVAREFQPETVFIHRNDDHTDHQAIYKVGIGVFQKQNIFLYYIPRPAPETPFDSNYAEDISDFIEQKVAMCKCHKSQPPDYVGSHSVNTNSLYWYLRWYWRIAPREDGHAEAFIIRGWRARYYGEPSPHSESEIPGVRYELRLVREPDGTLRWEEG